MSCHTWIYKKATLLNKEQQKIIVESARDRVNSLYDYKSFDEYKSLFQPFYANEVEQFKQTKSSIQDFENDEDALSDYQELVDLMEKWEILATSDDALYKEYEERNTSKKNAATILAGDVESAYKWIVDNLGKNEMEEEYMGVSYLFHDGYLYMCIGFDKPFRAYGYLENTFTDKQTLLDFLKQKNDSSFGYYDHDLNDFIEGYTEELEKRISDYFDSNEEGSLFINFR